MKPPMSGEGTFVHEGEGEHSRWVWKEFTPEEVATRKAVAEAAKKKAAEEWILKVDEEQRLAVPQTIERLHKEAAAKIEEANQIEKLLGTFPDLRRQTGRWEKVAYSARSANPLVDQLDVRHNCSCCNDSPLEIWPYKQTPDGRVYSNPSCFTVGERACHGGNISYSGWDEKMRAAGIPEPLIDQVQGHFRSEEPTEDIEKEDES